MLTTLKKSLHDRGFGTTSAIYLVPRDSLCTEKRIPGNKVPGRDPTFLARGEKGPENEIAGSEGALFDRKVYQHHINSPVLKSVDQLAFAIEPHIIGDLKLGLKK